VWNGSKAGFVSEEDPSLPRFIDFSPFFSIIVRRSLVALFVPGQVKWSRENYHHSLSSPYSLRLASGDASGKIIVWDVVSGTAHCEIQEHSKPIQGR